MDNGVRGGQGRSAEETSFSALLFVACLVAAAIALVHCMR